MPFARSLRSIPALVPTRVGVRIGSMAAIDPESLNFCFNAVVQGHGMGESEAGHRTLCRAQRICNNCGHIFVVEAYNSICTACASE